MRPDLTITAFGGQGTPLISPPVIVSLKGWKLTAYVENLRKGVKCRPCNKRRVPRIQPTLPTFYDQHLEARSNR